MDRAIAEFRVDGPGIRTTNDLLRYVLGTEAFRAGSHTTAYLDELRANERLP
jgi:acetyl-CoA carboxylase biotin carboxylase subunit